MITQERDRSRQSGLVDSEIFKIPVTVIGAGAIGSFTTLALAKIGFAKIEVWDNDSVEVHNIPNQFYQLKAIGKPKVEALAEMVKEFEGIEIKQKKDRFEGGIDLKGLVISAVDNMAARKDIFGCCEKADYFVDGRMGGNQFEVYTVNLNNKKDVAGYRKTLWDDKDTAPVPCTHKAVMYNVLGVSSWIVNQVRLVLSGKEYNRQLILDLENMILINPKEK